MIHIYNFDPPYWLQPTSVNRKLNKHELLQAEDALLLLISIIMTLLFSNVKRGSQIGATIQSTTTMTCTNLKLHNLRTLVYENHLLRTCSSSSEYFKYFKRDFLTYSPLNRIATIVWIILNLHSLRCISRKFGLFWSSSSWEDLF